MSLSLLPTNAVLINQVAVTVYGVAPGATLLANYEAHAKDNGIDATLSLLLDAAGLGTDANFNAIVLANLGLSGEPTAVAYMDSAVAANGRLATMKEAFNYLGSVAGQDNAYGVAGTAFNSKVTKSIEYSSVASNTSYSADAVSAASIAVGSTFVLTTNTDSFTGGDAADVFNASNSAGTAAAQTFNSGDVLSGGAGEDTLNATVGAASTFVANNVSGIETVKGTFSAAGTISLLGSSGVTLVESSASTAAAIFSNISSTSVGTKASDTAQAATFTYTNAALAGSSDSVALEVANVTGAATMTIDPTSGTKGAETIVLTSSSAANSITLDDGTSTTLTTLTINGDQDLTLVTTPTTITTLDASALTGGLTHTVTNTAAVTVTGGSGDDDITAEATASSDSISVGAGDDKVTFTATLATTDTVSGGDGTDTLELTTALATGYTAPTTVTITGFEKLEVSNALAGNLTTANIQAGFETLDLAAGTDGTARVVTLEAGAKTFELGASLGAQLTVNDTGSATTDSLTIKNTASAADDMGDANALVIGGFETVTINTTAVGSTSQDFGNITMTADSGGTDTLIVVGSDVFTSGTITAEVVDASGLTAAFTNTGASGLTSLTGGAGNDTLVGDASSYIVGNAGKDTITGGSGNDTILGGEGIDSITSGAGNDTIDGGAGNDIIVMGANLATGDTIDGGDGTDTLSVTSAGTLAALDDYAISAATALNANILNIERVLVSDSFNTGQAFDMARLNNINHITLGATKSITGNETLSGLANGSTVVVNNVANATTDILTLTLGDSTGSADELTYEMSGPGGNTNFGVFAVSGVETLNIVANEATASSTKRTYTIDTNITVSSNGTTVNLSGAEGVTVGTAIAAQTITSTLSGAFIMSSTASGLAQTITSGSGADTLYGGGGADTIDGGAGADSLVGGTGADSITGGTGADTIDGGAGNDTIVLTEDTAAVDEVTIGWSESGAYIDTIVGFTTGSSGDNIALDVSELSKVTASGGIDANATVVTDLFDGNAAGTTDGLQVITGAATVADAKNILVLQGSTLSSTGELEDALETGGAYALTVSTTDADIVQHDSFFAVYSDGTDAYVASVRVETDPSTNGVFAAAGLEAENLVKITGVSSIGASTFATANFDFV